MLGADLTDAALFVARFILGTFFVLARFRFFYDPSRADCWFNGNRCDSLASKMLYCSNYVKGWGLGKWPYFWAWTAAIVEVGAGLLVLLGLLTLPAAFALLVTLLLATRCTARVKVMEQHPVDAVDCVACYLWRVEGVYIGLALIILLAGPGAYSIDYLIWR